MTGCHSGPCREFTGALEMCEVREFGEHDLATDFSEPGDGGKEGVIDLKRGFGVDDFGEFFPEISDFLFTRFNASFQ